jgi:hypothetical protein
MVSHWLLVGHVSVRPSSPMLVLLSVGGVPCLSLRENSSILTAICLVRMKTKKVIDLLLLIRGPHFYVVVFKIPLFHIPHHFLLHVVLLGASSRPCRWRSVGIKISSVGVRVPISRSSPRSTSLRLRSRVLIPCENHFATSSWPSLTLKLSALATVKGT